MIFKNKIGVSEVVAYVILIVIALSLSVVVYAYLKIYVPDEVPKCPESVSLVIVNYTCPGSNEISITFINKGLHDVDGAYIKFSNQEEGNLIYQPLPVDGGTTVDSEDGFFDFGAGSLKPGQRGSQKFGYGTIPSPIKVKRVQIEPFVTDDITHKPVICDKNVIVQEMSCP